MKLIFGLSFIAVLVVGVWLYLIAEKDEYPDDPKLQAKYFVDIKSLPEGRPKADLKRDTERAIKVLEGDDLMAKTSAVRALCGLLNRDKSLRNKKVHDLMISFKNELNEKARNDYKLTGFEIGIREEDDQYYIVRTAYSGRRLSESKNWYVPEEEAR